MVSIFAQLAADAKDKQNAKDAQQWAPPAFDAQYDASNDPVILNHRAAKQGGTATAGATSGKTVWMGGWRGTGNFKTKAERDRFGYAERDVVSLDAAQSAFWDWSPQKREQEKRRAERAIGAPAGSLTTDDFLKVWKQAVQWSTQSSESKHPITPFDAMDLMARDQQAAVALNGGVKRSVTKSVDEISDGTAWGYLSDAAKQMLGRAPTSAELRRFVGKANDIASRNPTVTMSTASADGKTTTTKQESGASGADYALAAQNMTAADPEAAAYQVAGNYMDALIHALDSDVQLSSPLL